jgi:sucrose phosphorylase
MLITETNVPHAENISYFGNGKNEAQLVYNFALPPLVLHTLYSGDCRRLAQWAQSLVLPSDQTTFFNFLASHDGIGINPARGILVDEEINNMVEKAITYGGLVSSRSNSDGSSSPYELNINYFDALSDPNRDETEEIQINRFICAQAIMLAMVGVPGIYFHSLFGSRGWPKGVRKTGQNRTINRQKLEKQILEEELSNPGSRRARIFNHYRQLLKARSSTPAFDPYGSLRVIDCGSSIFGLLRENRTGENQNKCVLCLYNITATCQPLEIDLHMFHLEKGSHSRLIDLKSGKSFPTTENLRLSMQPYQVYWLACV